MIEKYYVDDNMHKVNKFLSNNLWMTPKSQPIKNYVYNKININYSID